MISNKTILVLTVSLIAGILLAGCGTQATPEPTAVEASQSMDVEAAPTEMPESAPADIPTAVSTEVPIEAPTDPPSATVSFANDVMPIIQSRCINCHGGERIEASLLMRTYDEVMVGSENGAVIIPSDVEGSLLVELVTNQKMPKRGPKLTPPQVQIITEWVAAGAPNN